MFEYRLNFCRSVTATLRGAFGVGIVVVGPLKQALAEESASIVESGIAGFDGAVLKHGYNIRACLWTDRIIGLIYSANIGDDFAMFEDAHGSAAEKTLQILSDGVIWQRSIK